ncbi:uncharacterized protein LOC144828576 [Lissotriton helveticus]
MGFKCARGRMVRRNPVTRFHRFWDIHTRRNEVLLKCFLFPGVLLSSPSIMCKFVTWNVRGIGNPIKRQKVWEGNLGRTPVIVPVFEHVQQCSPGSSADLPPWRSKSTSVRPCGGPLHARCGIWVSSTDGAHTVIRGGMTSAG